MLDIAFIRQNADIVRAAIKNKRIDMSLDELLDADRERRKTIVKIERERARKNEIAQLIAKASKEERPSLIEEART
jgi:seryl-tRNA synthetase